MREISSLGASDQQETDMQTMVFTGRLAADPQISEDFAKAVFRLIEKRGVDSAGKDRLVGVNCVSWSKGLNEKVIARGLAQGCEAVVIGAYKARDGAERTAKELVINRLTVLDWAEDRETDTGLDDRAAA
jgi:single-strand DNA-binding protein